MWPLKTLGKRQKIHLKRFQHDKNKKLEKNPIQSWPKAPIHWPSGGDDDDDDGNDDDDDDDDDDGVLSSKRREESPRPN